METYLHIAGFIIEIRFGKTEPPYFKEAMLKEQLEFYYTGFVLKKKPKQIDYRIEIVYRKHFAVTIDEKKRLYYFLVYKEKKNRFLEAYYNISIEQFQTVLRRALQELLAHGHGMILHASASLVKGKAFIFSGESGAGKSTMMSLLSEKFPALADDTIIIMREGKKFIVYQTPFREKNFLIKISKKYPLGKIFFLKKAERVSLEEITKKEKALSLFLKQFFSNRHEVASQMKDVMELVNENRFYILSSNAKSSDVIQLVETL